VVFCGKEHEYDFIMQLRPKFVLQEWGFCGRVGKPPEENEILISRDAQPRILADQMTNDMVEKRRKNDLEYMKNCRSLE